VKTPSPGASVPGTPVPRATIYSIAREAGVSVSTVSRVLTGSARVAEEKRRAVDEAIRRHNYRPSLVARRLARKQSRVIGFIIPDVSHPFYGAAFLGAENRAVSLGYSLLLGNTLNDNTTHVTNVESRLLSVMLETQVDGIIMMGGRVNETTAIPAHVDEMQQVMAQVPVVTASGRMQGVDCLSVEVNEAHGMQLAVNYLVTLGHRKIGFVGGYHGIEPSDTRMRSFRSCLEDHGLSCDETWCIEGGFDIEGGRTVMEAFLSLRHRPTAVICFNDLVAIGALYEARKNGLRVPEDVSLVGVDNISLGEYVYPRLTSVNLDARRQGATAVDLMVDTLEGKKSRRHLVLLPRLSIRDSCQMLAAES
jgi:DNA-binding LacI/PurR family transcriptional regulator